MALHHLALKQAYPFLRTGGRALSSIGGRVPLDTIIRLGRENDYASEILTYTWKVQSEPEEVIGGYAKWERAGRGPFHFYPASILADTFKSIAHVAAGDQASKIEEALSLHALSAQDALAAHRSQTLVGHTVVVLESIKHKELLI